MKEYGIAIIGAGLMGNRRGDAIHRTGLGRIVAAADNDIFRAIAYGEKFSCSIYTDWREVLSLPFVDIAVISVPNACSAEIIEFGLQQKKHILCEKPLGRTAEEAHRIISASKDTPSVIRVGFNHRFHGALYKTKELLRESAIGDILTIRARYGHGGRLGMEKEWRFIKNISGGGELLDQGVHLIDLCRWYGGDFSEIFAITEKKFWDADVEDNAFVLMKNQSVTAQFHVSVTNWKNIFSFEIFGTHGFLSIEGLGGSYGKETLTYGKRKLEFGIPDMEVFAFDGDTSWDDEWRHFIRACNGESSDCATVYDGYAANSIVEAAYASSHTKSIQTLTYEKSILF